MSEIKKNIGNSKLADSPEKPFKIIFKDKSVKTKHLDEGAVTTPKIGDRQVTPEKLSEGVRDAIVTPAVSQVNEKFNNITDQIDGKYDAITQELYSMVRSIQVSGVALSGKTGDRTDIGIHQKALTRLFGNLWEELGTLSGKQYLDYALTVDPVLIPKEGTATITVSAESTGSILEFEHIQLFVNDEIQAESHDVSAFTHDLVIENYGISTVKAVGSIMGKTIVKEVEVEKLFPFFIGSGQVYTDVIKASCQKDLVGTLEGDYDVMVSNPDDYIFIIIPASHRNEFRRADMNGIDMKVEIPFRLIDKTDYIVYQSMNTYQEGLYNIDIDINS